MVLQININPVCRKKRVQFLQLKSLQQERMCKYLIDRKRLESCRQFCDVKQCVCRLSGSAAPITFVKEALSHWIIQ